MDTTVVVAGMGFGATLVGTWMSGRLQRRAALDERMLEAKVRTYGDCSSSLYEYSRSTFNRVRARMDDLPESVRAEFRQEAYRANTSARSAIGQVAILSGDETLRDALERARRLVGGLNEATDKRDLKRRHTAADEALQEALDRARHDLMIRRGRSKGR